MEPGARIWAWCPDLGPGPGPGPWPRARIPQGSPGSSKGTRSRKTGSYFEGVCLTHVILAPGACGREGPTCRACDRFRLIRLIRLIRGLNSASFLPRLFCAQARYLRALALKTLAPTVQILHPKKCRFRFGETLIFKMRARGNQHKLRKTWMFSDVSAILDLL